ncbi:hypothetical protein ACRQ5D_31685 [Mucilaginibacter sp. P25]|jgi:hypothetical protein|uniref:Outer membrane protein beta-barrel domain-containing protein n=1 Tax=Mucilaginibacter gossypiicola TaxID=551995 RepID=A0A1H8B0Y5_9SPHI|nr:MULTISPECIES: hypothetical protein [Mucilaginibacter]UOE52180.1 hypothetical protein MTO98_13935 [Mucilaginibacter sp. SMC90]SEM76443.1 hypothetical protein SAMN05192574_101737 [Mucilaginibacter gossypiicola]
MVTHTFRAQADPRNPIARLWGGVSPFILLVFLGFSLNAQAQANDHTKYPAKHQSVDTLREERFRISYALNAFPVRTTMKSDGRLSWINYGLQFGVSVRLHRECFLQAEAAKNFGTNNTYYRQYGLHLAYDIHNKRAPDALILTPYLGVNFFRFHQPAKALKGSSNYLIGGLNYNLSLSNRLSLYASTGLSDLKLRGDQLLYPTNLSAAIGMTIKLLPHQLK